MKSKILLLFIAFVMFAQTLLAQTDYTGKLEFNLLVDQTEWNIGSRVMAKVTVKNVSDKRVEITLMPNFALGQKEIPKGAFLEAYTYLSNEHLEDSKIIKKEENLTEYEIQQSFKISLNNNESKTVEFDVTKLGWLRAPESNYFGDDWYYGVPGGEYELYYKFGFDLGIIDNIPRYGWISSNKVDVKLNSLE